MDADVGFLYAPPGIVVDFSFSFFMGLVKISMRCVMLY
jgi:hypothetical protein